MENKDFCIFILTHGRPDGVITDKTLRRMGCTYPIFYVIDNEDESASKYIANFGADKVVVFDKLSESKTFDAADNFDDRRCIVYARNACFAIAEKLGYKYFLEMDDDYREFKYRINGEMQHPKLHFTVKNKMDEVIDKTLDFYKRTQAKSVAWSQGGDWFDGAGSFGKPKRKCMNSFFCSVERPFKFVGRINEDVNTYTWFQSTGNLFLTVPFIQLDQIQTQSNSGGMTSVYLANGTYLKSFYSVIFAPSCVKVSSMGEKHRRLHHRVSWNNAVPVILSPDHKK